MSQLICPVCGEKLSREGKVYSCPGRHSYDIAKSGYVNLLPPAGKGRHGDDRLMVKARTEFLNRGYYLPLAKKLAELSTEIRPSCIVDAGCGEGYYTSIISEVCPKAEIIGLDISKDAVSAAAKKCRGEFAAASTAAMPLPDGCADLILNIFSPFFPGEFARVLTAGGTLIRVIPLEKHLHELRELVYDNPYDNVIPVPEADGFAIEKKTELKYRITLASGNDIKNLFMMTPYYYKTSEEDQKKLLDAETLETAIEFGILVYKKQQTL